MFLQRPFDIAFLNPVAPVRFDRDVVGHAHHPSLVLDCFPGRVFLVVPLHLTRQSDPAIFDFDVNFVFRNLPVELARINDLCCNLAVDKFGPPLNEMVISSATALIPASFLAASSAMFRCSS